MSGLSTRAWPGAGRPWGRWVGLRLGPAVLLSAGALLGLSAAGVTVASVPTRADAVTVASGPAAVSGSFHSHGRTGLAPLGCCVGPPSRASFCIAC